MVNVSSIVTQDLFRTFYIYWVFLAMYAPAMGQMPRKFNFVPGFHADGMYCFELAPQAYMPPPPGTYPPPPNGAGPRPSIPPTPIPAHAHPYYHQSPQRTPCFIWINVLEKCLLCPHSAARSAISHDDATTSTQWSTSCLRRWSGLRCSNGPRVIFVLAGDIGEVSSRMYLLKSMRRV
jgi:hypothetical protein